MDTKSTKASKTIKKTPEYHKESKDEDMRSTGLNSASSLVTEYNELKMKDMELRFERAELTFEKRFQEIKRETDEMIAIMTKQELAICLRIEDEEWRHFMERIIIIAFAFLAAIGKLLGFF